MKLIDEKGRLLGLINLIDLIAIGLVLALAAGFYLKAKDRTEVVATPVTIKANCQWVRPEVAASLKVGDRIVAAGAFQPVVIKDIKITPAITVTTRADGTRLLTEDPYVKDVLVTLEGTANKGAADLSVGGQEARIGKKFLVKTQTVELEGYINEITWMQP